MAEIKGTRIRIKGVVQGVGFRPFVYNLARKFHLKGYVLNDSNGVEILASGNSGKIREFLELIPVSAPPQSVIDSITTEIINLEKPFSQFSIKQSLESAGKFTRISPDLRVCDDCIEELLDSENRRYYYPFINCTNCGPRYTIIEDVPYDRPKTTMKIFPMCPECAEEYHDPANRRFHAQPNACHVCGPHLTLSDKNGQTQLEEHDADSSILLFQRVASLLQEGKIIAVKGIGGFHIACDATNEEAVRNLRSRKYREDKPFAIMVKSVDQAEEIARMTISEQERLQDTDRPIILLEKKDKHQIAPSVAPNNRYIGVMLPYTPIHYLLFRHVDFPLVMTSANISDEPIAYDNDDALERLREIVDYYLMGNRDILIRCDDSVTRIVNGLDYPIRRSRGVVPTPIRLEKPFAKMVLAVGGEQKNTICVGREEWAILSHHIGDLENIPTLRSFQESIRHLQHVFDIAPELIAYDLHPEYLSTKFVFEPSSGFEHLAEIPKIGVQHHHAHIVSCMADNGIYGDVIGVALDGTGYGTDGDIWGGEIMLASEKHFSRLATFRSTVMPGGATAIKNPWRMALSYLYSTLNGDTRREIPSLFSEISPEEMKIALFQIEKGINSPVTTSCGRLFDGVASLLGLRAKANYEGQPAVELEQAVRNLPEMGYRFELRTDANPWEIDWRPCIAEIVSDLKKSLLISEMAGKFHIGLIKVLAGVCMRIYREYNLRRVVLSGGCFMNMILLQGLTESLKRAGLEVFSHRQIPCNDGGISLGQAVIAAHQ